MQEFYDKYLTSKKRPLEDASPTSSKRSKTAEEVPILPVNQQIPEFFGLVKRSENEKKVKHRLK